MKVLPRLVAAALLAAIPLAAQTRADVNEAEKLLRETSAKFVKSLDGVDETQWNFRPPNGRHSIGDLAEHISFATNELQRVIQEAVERGPQPEAAKLTEGKLETIREIMFDKEKPPLNFQPRGKLVDKADIDEFFPQAQRKALALLAEVKGKQPELCVYTHPSQKLQQINALQWFYYIAYLMQAHIDQIELIKAHEQYPRS